MKKSHEKKSISLEDISKSLDDFDQNPFDVPDDSKIFDIREQQNKEKKDRFAQLKKMSLADRTVSGLPQIHSKSKWKDQSSKSMNEDSTDIQIAPPVAEHQARQVMSDFVDQRREIFLVQLLIDRKEKEIQRIQQTRKTEKKNIVEEESKIAETINQYKMTANQIEVELQRRRKAMESAIKERIQLSKELKAKRSNVAIMKSENLKNEEILNTYREYADFVKKLTPEGFQPLQYMNGPQKVLEELEKIENENLFLVRQCQEFQNVEDSALHEVSTALKAAEEEKNRISDAFEKIGNIESENYKTENVKNSSQQLEKRSIELTNMVKVTYRACFGKVADINALAMLEQLENKLELLFEEAKTISPDFIQEKLTQKRKKRREEARLKLLKHKELEQQAKLEQALKRAQKPIKRKTNRPVNARVLPIKPKKKIDIKKKQSEENAINQFLYGPLED